MGKTYGAICKSCGYHFEAHKGGGFFFHVLHCDHCGKEKTVSFDQLGDAHLRYVKGLEGPYSKSTKELDKYVRENYPDTPLTVEEYHAIVEGMAGDHECGGHFTFDAAARCPKCGSLDVRKDPDVPEVSYD